MKKLGQLLAFLAAFATGILTVLAVMSLAAHHWENAALAGFLALLAFRIACIDEVKVKVTRR